MIERMSHPDALDEPLLQGPPAIATRFVIAQSWWWASELVRRHPDLWILHTHAGGGMYDSLSIVRAEHELININRGGSIHFFGEPGHASLADPWALGMRQNDPHAVVRYIEHAAGLSRPHATPVATPKTLAYRVIARLLLELVDDKARWNVEAIYLDSSGDDCGTDVRDWFSCYPTLEESFRTIGRSAHPWTPGHHVWALEHVAGENPPGVALIDTTGTVHHRNGTSTELMPLYRSGGRRLTRLVAATLGDELP